jgi:hypothetical protein
MDISVYLCLPAFLWNYYIIYRKSDPTGKIIYILLNQYHGLHASSIHSVIGLQNECLPACLILLEKIFTSWSINMMHHCSILAAMSGLILYRWYKIIWPAYINYTNAVTNKMQPLNNSAPFLPSFAVPKIQ